MQQVANIEDLKNVINKKIIEDEIENKLVNAEKQIKEGKTFKASEVFKELEEQYGF